MSAIAAIGALALIAVVVALGVAPRPGSTAAGGITPAALPGGIVHAGMSLGRPDAPVRVDLYEDFQCPACRQWGETVFPSLLDNEVGHGRAQIVFHDVAFLGQESIDAGLAAYAADRQDRFWDMWRTLYANQSRRENAGGFDRANLVAMAVALGMDSDRFVADMESPEARASLATSIAEGRAAGIVSTPTLVIGGRAYEGAGTYADVSAAIAAAAP